MQRTMKGLALGLVVACAAISAHAQTGTLQGRQLFLYDNGSGSQLNRIELVTPSNTNLTANYQLVLPQTAGAAGAVLANTGTAGTLEFTTTPSLTSLTLSGPLTVGGLATFNGGINISTLTPNRPLKVDGTGNVISALINLSAANDVTGVLPVTSGGTGLNSVNTGDILYGSAANTLSALGIGAAGEYLGVTAGLPDWKPLSADVWTLGGNTADITATNNILGINFTSPNPLRIYSNAFERMRVTSAGDVRIQNLDPAGATQLNVVGTATQAGVNLLNVQNSALNFAFRVDEQPGTLARIQIGDGTLDGRIRLFNGAPGGVANIDVQNSLAAAQTYTIPTIEANGRFVVSAGAGTAGQILQSNGNNNRSSWTSTPSLTSLTLSGDLQVNGNTTLGSDNADAVTINGVMSFPGLTPGLPLQTNLSGQVVSELINLTGAADVTGTLPVGNGGTGAVTFTTNGVIYGNGTSPLQATAVGAIGQVFVGTGAAPAWSGSPTLSGTLTVEGATNLGNGDASDFVTINTGAGNNLAIGETGILRVGQIDIFPGAGNIVNTDGGLTVAENLTVNGNSTLGNAATDQVSVVAATLGAPNLNTTPTSANVLVRNAGNIEVSTATFATSAGVLANNSPVRTNGSGQLTTGNLNLATEVTGTLAVTNGGTGSTSYGANRVIVSNGTGTALIDLAPVNNAILVTDGTGVPSFSTTFPTTVNVPFNQVSAGTNTAALVVGGGGTLSPGVGGTITANALTGVGTNGIVARTAAGTFAPRTIVGVAPISVADGNGVAGDPTISLTGIVPVANGGTGAATFATNGVIYGNGTSPLQATAVGAIGEVFVGTGAAPAWSGSPTLSGNLGVNGNTTLGDLAADQVTINAGTVSAANLPTTATTANVLVRNAGNIEVSTATFATSAGVLANNSPVRTNGSGQLTTGNLNLATEVTGTLPVTNGGTGSTSYGANRVIVSNGTGTALIDLAPVNNAILVTDGTGVPSFSITFPTTVNVPFNQVSAGTNTAALVVGGGGTLSPGVGGTITANALTGVGTNGIVARTAAGTFAPRTIVGVAPISVADGNGVSGDPTISLTGVVPVANGGTGLSTAPINSILYASAANTYSSLAPGANGDVLSIVAGVPTWTTPAGSSFSAITSGTNTTATMTVGTGASIVPSGTGVIRATEFQGSGSTTTAVDLQTAEVAGTLPVANGGTGATTAAGARTNLGAQTQSTQLDNLSSLATTGIMVRTGVNTFATKVIDVNAPLTITNADGTAAGNPTISLGTVGVANGGTGLTATPTNGQIPIGNGTGYTLATITGTTNQVTVTNGVGTITLSTPQDIHTGANPTFNNLSLTGTLGVNGNTTLGDAANDIVTNNGRTVLTANTPGATAPTGAGAALAAFGTTWEKVEISNNGTGATAYVFLPAGTDGQVMYVRFRYAWTAGANAVIVRQPDNVTNTAIAFAGGVAQTIVAHMIYSSNEARWVILSAVNNP